MIRVLFTTPALFWLLCTPSFGEITLESCSPGEYWVRAHHRRAYTRADGTFVRPSGVSAHCQKNPAGFDHWNPRKRKGLPPGWQHPEEKSKAWTEEEWERVLEALSELPELLWVPSVEGIYRLAKSRFPANPAAGEPKSIAIYDAAFETKRNLTQILAHELAHELYRSLSETDVRSYQRATHWFERQVGKRTLVIRGRSEKQFISEDGVDSPAEDFSNNIEHYLFDPKRLEKITSTAHKWIQQRFGDKLKFRSR